MVVLLLRGESWFASFFLVYLWFDDLLYDFIITWQLRYKTALSNDQAILSILHLRCING